jgi:hypothetical protein
MEAAEFINEKSAKQQLNGLWSGFQGKKVEPESLQDWYYKHLEELKNMAAQR